MSRSGYSDDGDGYAMWRGMVASATRGKRGQQLLRELAAAMDAMPVKELIAEELKSGEGHCALGVVGEKRGVDLSIDPEDYDRVAKTFNIAPCLAQEIVYVNDEEGPHSKEVDGKWVSYQETNAERWTRVRKWVAEQIRDGGDSPR